MKKLLIVVIAVTAGGCAVRHPAYVTVPWGQFRSGAPSKLPLTAEERTRLTEFFNHDGNTSLHDTVPDGNAAAHREALEALGDAANLAAQTNQASRTFCEMAASLCGKAGLFRKQPVVQQVVDARDPRPPFPPPLAVSDGHYWWIFQHSHGQLTELLVVRTIDREIKR